MEYLKDKADKVTGGEAVVPQHDMQYSAVVTYIHDPSSFYIMKAEHRSVLNELQANMGAFYNYEVNRESTSLSLENVEN